MSNIENTREEDLISSTLNQQINKHKPPARLTVVEQVYHQRDGAEPLLCESKYYRWLTENEQPWVREFMVGTNWRQLEYGWLVNGGSMLVVKNLEGKHTTNLTDEEKLVLDSKIIELGVIPISTETPTSRNMHSSPRKELLPIPFAVIRPGHSCRIEPIAVSQLYVRCRNEDLDMTAKCLVNLIPN